MKTIFIPCRAQADVELVVGDIVKKVDFERIGLVTTAQFVHELDEIKEGLEKAGKKVFIAPGRPNPGQVLGCDAQAAKGAAGKGAECIVYLGTGRFHPLRAAEETGLPTYMVHPSGGMGEVSKDQLMKHRKIRAARVHRFKEAKTVGILVSTKPGQERFEEALKLKERFKEKEAFVFVANELNPGYFTGYGVDAWVNTACPRIAEDLFGKPVADVSEIKGI